MFDIGPWEFAALAVIALLVFGPDKLPKIAADAGRLVRQLREMASGAKADLTRELGPEFDELRKLNLNDLNPRTFVTKALLDDDPPVPDSASTPQATPPRQAGPRPEPSAPSGPAAEAAAPRWDPDAT